MNPHSAIPDPERLLTVPLVWEADPEDVLWLRAMHDGQRIFLRINNFPDENLYSLYVGDGRFLQLEDMPSTWSRVGPLEWPPTARPRERLYMD